MKVKPSPNSCVTYVTACKVTVTDVLFITKFNGSKNNCDMPNDFGFILWFPLCANKNDLQFNTLVENHPSAVNFPSDVDTYFQKELVHNLPFPVHYSPILSRPKPDDTRCIIVNLNYPYGMSLNDCISDDVYDNMSFKLKYPAVQDIVDEIQAFHSDVLLLKIDISRAFRNLRIDPRDFDLLELKWCDASYLDVSVPMVL